MAGRPRSEAAKPSSSLAESLTAQLMAPAVAPPMPVLSVKLPKSDRQALERWWSAQFDSMAEAARERARLLAEAADHPNEVAANMVRRYGALGVEMSVTATLLGMSTGELELFYGAEYAMASAEVMSLVSQNFIRMAIASDDRYAVKAAIEFLNRRGGEEYRAPAQKIQVEDTRKRGNVIDASKLTHEERQQLKAIIQNAMARRVDSGTEAVPAVARENE
jgi:hypothetical protein